MEAATDELRGQAWLAEWIARCAWVDINEVCTPQFGKVVRIDMTESLVPDLRGCLAGPLGEMARRSHRSIVRFAGARLMVHTIGTVEAVRVLGHCHDRCVS